jgi:hypothetical protein
MRWAGWYRRVARAAPEPIVNFFHSGFGGEERLLFIAAVAADGTDG